MWLVLDTNTIISGLLWAGKPGKLLDFAQVGQITLFTSIPLLTELQGVINRRKFAKQIKARGLSASDFFDGYAALANLVSPAVVNPIIVRDPADVAVLACALAAQADLIVSGDGDLLTLREFHGIHIVNPATALTLIE